MARGGSKRVHGRLAALLLLAGLTVDCTIGMRFRGQTYGPEGRPYLSPAVTERLEAREPVHRLVLIGDGGEPLPDDPTLRALGSWTDDDPDRTTVLFLGDNLYPDGLRESDRARGERVLRQQIRATPAEKIFLPGNHDWGFSARALLQAGRLRAQQLFIDSHVHERAELLPKQGCPGPVTRSLVPPGAGLARGLVVIAVDFHWWLLPEQARPLCAGIDDTDAFLARLEQELEAHAAENVIVAAHHPLRSGGPHGGLTRGFWTDLGATLFHRMAGTLQDVWEPSYAQMILVVSETLTSHPPVAFVAGHDHGLQILEGGDVARLLVVSGAASAGKITGVAAIDGTLFAHAHTGFVVLDFVANDLASDVLVARVVETGQPEPVYTIALRLGAPPIEAPPTRGPGDPKGARPQSPSGPQ
jgi:hypothetical protein